MKRGLSSGFIQHNAQARAKGARRIGWQFGQPINLGRPIILALRPDEVMQAQRGPGIDRAGCVRKKPVERVRPGNLQPLLNLALAAKAEADHVRGRMVPSEPHVVRLEVDGANGTETASVEL